jgi:putative Mg2+ transporter-C (MgtC) family protein
VSVWTTVWQTLQAEFADVADAAGMTRVVTRLVLAAVLGGILGYERERTGKDAGLRTHMLIALGAALFVLVPQQAGVAPNGDLTRVIQGIVAGVGFIGGGTILKLSEERRVEGLTTAAGLWLTASIGMVAGLGRAGSAIVATVFALAILTALARASQRWNPKEPPPEASEARDEP